MTKRTKILLVVTSLVLGSILACVFARAMSVTDPTDPMNPQMTEIVVTTLQAPNTGPGTEDTGVMVCKMMNDDKASGTTPGKSRSADEVELLIGSHNVDLHKAGVILKTGDVATGLDAVSLLFSGCAALGIPLT